jgi:hypothetical protein
MADCTLFLVKSCQGSSYITLKVLSNKTKLIFIAISLQILANNIADNGSSPDPLSYIDHVTNVFHFHSISSYELKGEIQNMQMDRIWIKENKFAC